MKALNQRISDSLNGQRRDLATLLVEREFAQRPGLVRREEAVQDADDHFAFLAQAVALDNRSLFIDYVAWAKVAFARRTEPTADLAGQFALLAEVLQEKLPPESATVATGFVRAALEAMPTMPDDMPTFLHEGEPLNPLAYQYLEALRRGERQIASRLVLDAVAAGTPVKQIYLHVFQTAQYEIGRLWQTNRISIAREHYCTAATQLIMSQLYSHIFALEKKDSTLVATCVAGDLHELGVRMVADFFEMDGWDTFYLGSNTPNAEVIAAVVERKADVLAISATISYHVAAVHELIEAVRREPSCRTVKILVGGYPFTRNPELWRELGADGSAANAEEAIDLANRMVEGRAR